MEVLIGLVVFAVGILGLNAMQLSSIKGNSKGRLVSEASNESADQIERLLVAGYGDWDDTDGDGTEQDSDRDGIDDDGGNFGLNDMMCCEDGNDPSGNPVSGCNSNLERADGCFFRNGYNVYWNVAYNHNHSAIDSADAGKENSGLKTVRFLIEKPGKIKAFSIDMIRVDLRGI